MISTLSCIPVILSVYRDDPEISIESELQCLLRFFDASIHSAIGIDGYPVEDIGYGTSMLCFLGQLAEFLFRAGFYNAYANRRFLNAGNAILHFVQPWGQFLSNTGDHGDDINNRLPLLVNLSRHTGKKELLWLASTLYYNRNLIGGLGGWNPIGFFDEIVVRKTVHLPRNLYSLFYFNDIMQKRVHPEKLKVPTSFADRQTGIVSFRSGWGKNDTMVVFHGSQRSSLAEGHQHASCGHFSISSHGEYFAIDTGRYNMEQSCHNVVLINGKSGESTGGNWRAVRHHGVLLEYQPGKFVDYAAVDSSHQHNCYWAKRFLGMVKGNAYSYVWIVDDINYNDGSAEFVWQLHTAYGNQIEINDKKATITGFRYGNRMDIHWVIPDDWPYDPYTIKVEQDIAFPSSYKYLGFDPDENPSEILKKLKKIALTGFQKLEDMVHGPVYFRPRVFARIHGANGRFISFLIPYFANSHPPQLIKLKTVPNAFAVKIMWDKFEDTVIFSYGHNILETEDIAARGQWCVVRRNKRKKIINYALKDGEYLKIGGKNYRV